MLSHFSHVQLFVTAWIVARQAPPSIGFFRQDYWSGLPSPPLGDLPELGIEPAYPLSPISQEESLPPNHWGSPTKYIYTQIVNHLLLLS